MQDAFQIIAVDKVGCAALLVTPGGKIAATIPLLEAPHEVVLSPDGRLAYVSIYGSGIYKKNPSPGSKIQVLDLLTNTVVRTLSVAPYSSPHGLTFDAGGTLWASCDQHSCVVALCPKTGEIQAVVPTGTDGTHWVLASPDGQRLFTSNKETLFLSVIDPAERRVVNQIPTLHGSEGLCFSPDGRLLYIADHQHAQILVVDCQREELISVHVLSGLVPQVRRRSHHMRIRVSEDGATLAIAAYHHDCVVLMQAQNPSHQVVLETGTGPMAMVFHPFNPDLLYVSNHEDGTVALVSLAEERVLLSFPCGKGVESMEIVATQRYEDHDGRGAEFIAD